MGWALVKASRELDAEIASKVMELQPCIFDERASWSGLLTMWGCKHNGTGACYPHS